MVDLKSEKIMTTPDNLSVSSGNVLITGGNGLVGKYLTSLLLSEGFGVSHLSRGPDQFGRVRVFRWDPDKHYLNPIALYGIDYIIHLAGANIGEKRWTKTRKEEILKSRADSAKLMFDTVETHKIPLKGFITASATGYYGSVTSENIFTESDPPATDFLGSVCSLWEAAADTFSSAGIRTVKIRTAVILEKSVSLLARYLLLARFNLFPTLGSGKQYMPWVHISDLCRIYLKALSDEMMEGAYNAVSPDHTDNRKLVKTIAKVMKKDYFPLPAPPVLLTATLGEKSVIALKGSRVSSEKLIRQGFRFEFPELEGALSDLIMD